MTATHTENVMKDLRVEHDVEYSAVEMGRELFLSAGAELGQNRANILLKYL